MNTFTKTSVTIAAAKVMIAAAETRAKELGIKISTCIVDESGVMKAFSSMDGAPLISIKASHKKALTAVGFGLASGDGWFGFIKDDPILREGAHNFDDFILVGGGKPVMINNILTGAIGISGGHYKQDEDCADAALRAL
ncbi:MAG: hypothetical protein FMNOHCHN_01010 [Ignavibacteriaceae bacterium]|nr:hypothetical protein [Ignavibacteriaceae bacterium]